jgi:hypothetical protein
VTVIDLVLPIATVAWGVSAWRPRYIPETVSRTSHTARRDRPFADQDSGPITVRAHVSECLGLRPRNSEIPTYLSGAARQARQSSPLLGMTVMRDNGTDHLHVCSGGTRTLLDDIVCRRECLRRIGSAHEPVVDEPPSTCQVGGRPLVHLPCELGMSGIWS